MARIPYEIIAPEVERIILHIASSPIYYWQLYVGYISACGWTDLEFDNETLCRVDAAWTSGSKNAKDCKVWRIC